MLDARFSTLACTFYSSPTLRSAVSIGSDVRALTAVSSALESQQSTERDTEYPFITVNSFMLLRAAYSYSILSAALAGRPRNHLHNRIESNRHAKNKICLDKVTHAGARLLARRSIHSHAPQPHQKPKQTEGKMWTNRTQSKVTNEKLFRETNYRRNQIEKKKTTNVESALMNQRTMANVWMDQRRPINS